MATSKYGSVSTRPVKRFFVDMLTRDIALEDAILDLLDNCIDGVQRSISAAQRKKSEPYDSYHANIEISATHFEILDNCGGIPWSEHERAFRMGRPKATITEKAMPGALLVGVYGIGMKRAVFKMGTVASIETKTSTDEYKINIPDGWSENEDNWDLEAKAASVSIPKPGTRIRITKLNTATSERFGSSNFIESLLEKIEAHYSFIIAKGFKVTVNKKVVVARKIAVRFAEARKGETAIQPYIFKSKPEDGLEIFLVAGIREPIPDAEATLTSQEEPKLSTDYAGWTVICNDRVVLYCNRDELTGWGTANVPRYHTQFIAISGIVEFKGDPNKLPTTTTKRGLEFSSSLYQQVLNKMREGTRTFVDFTNWWKQNETEIKDRILPTPAKSLSEIKETAERLTFSPTRVGLKGELFKPSLPRPAKENEELRIAFTRPKKKVLRLANALLSEDELDLSDKEIARTLGEHLFDSALKSIR